MSQMPVLFIGHGNPMNTLEENAAKLPESVPPDQTNM